MTEERAICTLDYLIGTLATAYKGLITSLVTKDFCMAERDADTIFKGTIFSIPDGDYEAMLMHEGIEIARGAIKAGYFELKAETRLIEQAKNLQIDIVRNGRHIGTFLLKREKREGVFISALELSEETRDINFGLLTRRLHGKVGLLKKAEDIISAILSTKQNWRKLSEEINSFSKDIFWSDRNAYFAWFPVLVQWALKACEGIEIGSLNRAVANVVSLMELPLESESDMKRLRAIADTWLGRAAGSHIDLSVGLPRMNNVLARMHETFPDLDTGQTLRMLIESLRNRLERTPALTQDLLEKIKPVVEQEDYLVLGGYSEEKRGELLGNIAGTGRSLEEGEYADVFELVEEVSSWLSKDRDMISVFFETVEKNLSRDSAGPLTEALMEFFNAVNSLPADIYRRAIANTVKLIGRLIGIGRTDTCEVLLKHIEGQDDPLRADVILNAGTASEVLDSSDGRLLTLYSGMLGEILIPAPEIAGLSQDTWAELANPLHLERLSKFMEVLGIGGSSLRRNLVWMICNIYVSGVFIPDDRIFQREVSKYMNSGSMKEDFLLYYIFLKKLPVYYHEVGATGRLRDDSTEIDSWGNDPVLYFLRKQVHVNSSNNLISMIEEILKTWLYKDPGILEGRVPPDILSSLNPRMLDRYSAVVRPFFAASGLLDAGGFQFAKTLGMPDDAIDRALRDLEAPDEIRMKILLLCRIYRELTEKYSLSVVMTGKEKILPEVIALVNRIRQLKEVVVSPEKTHPEESLYFKRHIAFGIPSVMGSYHEPKFDAFGEMLRAEEKLRSFLDLMIENMSRAREDFAEDRMREWISCIGALNELLELHGLGNFQIDETIHMMKENDLYLSQIVDLLRICQKEITWLVEFLTKTFSPALAGILRRFPADELPESLRGPDPEDPGFISKASDIVIRAIMGGIAGFFELDRILDNFIDAVSSKILSDGDKRFSFSGRTTGSGEYFPLDKLSEEEAMNLAPEIGNKAKNLVYLTNKGLPVPHGVVFPSHHTRNYAEHVESSGFLTILKKAVGEIEQRTGRTFGGRKRPLFLSVRSGSYISMPGILSSILYCGINASTLQAFVEETNDPWLAWDSCRRFIEHFGTVVYDLDIAIFEKIVENFLKENGLSKREDLGAEQMQQIVRLYHVRLDELEKKIPDDVYEQLRESVKAVYRSWHSDKSRQFRKAMKISGHWGTSVTLMEMIYGNDVDSGASVFFTRKPFSLKPGIYGDTKEKATGSELVYGRSVNRPLTRQQEWRGQQSLAEVDPELFRMHEELARSIEDAMRGLPQEVEATYTRKAVGGRVIYVLQTRRMEFHRGFTKRFDDVCRMESKIIGRGVGVHGGALSGIATFASSPSLIRKMKKERTLPVILLRKEASTDDVALMPEIDGIVTAAGGVTSHAAVLAQKFLLNAIVGCSDMEIKTDEEGKPEARIGETVIREGDDLSMDGSTGLIYSGLCMTSAGE